MPYKNPEDMNAYMRKRYADNREFMQNYKVEHGCVDCGYNAHHAGLEFDHIGDDKIANVASLLGRGMTALLKEIAKCEVVCGTCHNIRTWERSRK